MLVNVAKTWVLQTETKGTGANVVPLDSVTRRSSTPEPVTVPRKPKRREPKPREPRAPRRFRIVDVTTRARLADDVGAAAAIDALKSVRSMVDVDVYVWQPERLRWRLLGLAEQQAM